jgi:hypothetical protein
MQFLKCLLVCASLSFATRAGAIIFRHDKELSVFTALAKDPRFDCVGKIYYFGADTPDIKGSCVLIDTNYVLTAWHVLKYGKDLNISNYQLEFKGARYLIDSYQPYPGEGYDMVLLKLTQSVQFVSAAPIDTLGLQPGDTVTLVGYGQQRSSDMLDGSLGIGIKTAAENIIDSAGGKMINNKPSRVYTDFDGPVPDGRPALPLEGMLNGGDSGGGLFILRKGQYYLTGIASGTRMHVSSKSGFDGSVMNWCYIKAYYSWLQQFR